MSLEKVIRHFASEKGFALRGTDNGLEIKGRTREWLFYEQGNGKEALLYGKSFALSGGIDESMIHVASSAQEQELNVNVRYGCLRDYINQLSASDNHVLVDLRLRLESRLGTDSYADRWAQETILKFNQMVIHDLLRCFYP